MTHTFTTLRQAFRDQILTASGWLESTIPYPLFSVDQTSDQPASPATDKTFAVGLMAIRDTHRLPARGSVGDLDGAYMEADVGIRLVNRIVPNDRQTSIDTALTEIHAVFVVVMSRNTSWPLEIGVLFEGEIVPEANATGEWLVTDLRFRARWRMAL